MSPDRRNVRTQIIHVDLTVAAEANSIDVADVVLAVLFAADDDALGPIVSIDGAEPVRR